MLGTNITYLILVIHDKINSAGRDEKICARRKESKKIGSDYRCYSVKEIYPDAWQSCYLAYQLFFGQ